MVSPTLSTLQPIFAAAAGDPSPPLFAHPKPHSPCFVRVSPRRPRKSPALSSARNVRRSAGAGPIAGEENGGEASKPETFIGSTKIADFMRLKWVPEENWGELQTAVVGYTKRFPWSLFRPSLRIDLVSTIHIADKQYFTTLQKELEQYDCVLFEMVASRESLESSGSGPAAARRLKRSHSRGFSIVGWIQRQLAEFYALDFQLDCLNYQPRNWFHADLDIETFEQLQLEKGESFFSFAIDRTLKSTEAIVQSTPTPDGLDPWRSKLLWASRVLPMPLLGFFIIQTVCDVRSEAYDEPMLDLGTAMKVFLARQVTSESPLDTADVVDESVIVGERNRAAIEALRKAIDNGNNKIAILYGAGHMPDLGRRLQEELDLVPSRVQWITAWSIGNRGLKNDDSFPWQQLLILFVVVVDLWFWGQFLGTVVDWLSQIAFRVDWLSQIAFRG